MDPSNTASLARIWADATPLAKFVSERAERLCREAAPARDTRRADQPSSAEQLVLYAQFQMNLMDAQTKAKTATINDLVAGRLVGLGRSSDSYSFESIDASFWIGAKVDWGGTASRGGRTVIELRIVMPDAIAPVQPKPQPGPGRPSKAQVIREAIDEYAKSDPALDRPRSERYRAYRSYISSQGYKRVRDAGFSDKTFEKYEREFRNKFK